MQKVQEFQMSQTPSPQAAPPRVSIGMPVYNGENYIEPAIDSILAQTFRDFELIICDNASTDRTEEICRAYAARDSRVRYYRNEQNIGANPNHNRTVELARGEYFKWAAHDDLCAPEFLERCVAVLDQHPEVVLCHSLVQIIGPDGAIVAKDDPLYNDVSTCNDKLRTDSPKPYVRFHDLACYPHPCYPIFGLMRMSALLQTPLQGSYACADRNLLVEMGLLGLYSEIPEFLFFGRRHPNQSIAALMAHRSERLYTLWADPSKAGKIILPAWRTLSEYLKSVHRVPLTGYERFRCYLSLLWWMRKKWRGLTSDLLYAAGELLARVRRSIGSGGGPSVMEGDSA